MCFCGEEKVLKRRYFTWSSAVCMRASGSNWCSDVWDRRPSVKLNAAKQEFLILHNVINVLLQADDPAGHVQTEEVSDDV